MALEDLLKGVQILAIVCNQYGDSGKGKFSDFFSVNWADVIARGTGGANAGHTVVINGKQIIFHLIPAGILYDKDGKINVLGNGMVIDIAELCKEFDELDQEGITYNNLLISRDAQVVMPYHIERDIARNKSQANGGIGSTGRGIGPCYTDKTARVGIKIGDLFDRDKLARKINRALEFYPEYRTSITETIELLMPYIITIQPFVQDTIAAMHRFVKEGKKISLEGAQGLLLSKEHGPDPYITSSDCSVNGTASGVGLSARAIDLTLGIVKFPFMTRVGGGPFPTELGGRTSEEYCARNGITKVQELAHLEIPYICDGRIISYDPKHPRIISLMNSDNPFEQGIGIRLAAAEYGATTGRPRRIGWTDAVAGRFAVGINGPLKLVLTKADAVAGLKEFRIAYSYQNDLNTTTEFPRDVDVLRSVVPDYGTYPGYSDIRGEKSYNALPRSLRTAIQDFENFVGAPAAIISTGAEQEHTIVR